MQDPANTARAFITHLLESQDPGAVPDIGDYSEMVKVVYEAFQLGGPDAVRRSFEVLSRDDPRFELIRPASLILPRMNGKSSHKFLSAGSSVPPLPESARLPEDLGLGACPWLDDYIEFSKYWSPSGYKGFHASVGIWILSTVAARRVGIPLGSKIQYTPLYIALTARSGLYAKSETASVGVRTIKGSGLGYLLTGDNYTPQALIKSMTGIVPPNYAALEGHDRTLIELAVAYSGQRSWYVDEFGGFVEGMRKKNGYMAQFGDFLRTLDGCEEELSLSTIGRGEDRIVSPSLSMLMCMTPSDLRSSGQRGSELWNNGFWARVAFCGPDGDDTISEDRMPNARFHVPGEILKPLHYWHERLGIPRVLIEPDAEPGKFSVARGEYPENLCTFGDGVEDAFYNYRNALSRLVRETPNTDLDGNYIRFPTKALRMSMLFASLENEGRIEMEHWALAQGIAEEWRANLHSVFEQINEPLPTPNKTLEDRILSFVGQWMTSHELPPTKREISQNMSADASVLKKMVDDMVGIGLLVEIPGKKTSYFGLPLKGGNEDNERQGEQ